MKPFKSFAAPLAVCTLFGFALATVAQEGPKSQQSETVAKPRKKPAEAEPEQEKIPSRFPKKDSKQLPEGVPTDRKSVV